MVCSNCNTEAAITNGVNVLKDGKLFYRMTFSCRNKGCCRFAQDVGTHAVEVPLVVENTEEETPAENEETEEVSE